MVRWALEGTCGQSRVSARVWVQSVDREAIPCPPCPSRDPLVRQPLPSPPAPWVCLPDVMKRESPHGGPVEAGSVRPHGPAETPPPGVSARALLVHAESSPRGSSTARTLSCSPLLSCRPAAPSVDPSAPAKTRLDSFPCAAVNRVSLNTGAHSLHRR